MQFNCNVLRNKTADITNFMYNNNNNIKFLITSAGNYFIKRKGRDRDNGLRLGFILERNVKCKMMNGLYH